MNSFRAFGGILLAQGAAAAVGLLTGLWVVRTLPPTEYALYTIAASVLGTMVLLADSGISAGTLARGGRVWRDKQALGAAVHAAFALRYRVAWGVSLLSLPVLLVLLLQCGASWPLALAWVAGVVFVFVSGLGQLIWEVPLRLHERLAVTQRTALGQAALRAGGTLGALALWPAGLAALLATGLAQAWASWRVGRVAREHIDTRAEADPEAKALILGIMRRSMPSALYHVATQQLALWFLSGFGSSLAVAQYGALSRISLILGVLTSINHALLAPRFARVEAARDLPRTYWRQLGIVMALCIPLNVLAWAAPEWVVALLGKSYAGLAHEARIAVWIGTIQAIGGAAFHLGYARGWLMPAALMIGSAMLVQAGCLLWLDLSTLHGALGLGLALALHQMITSLAYCVYRMRSSALVSERIARADA